ncbi:hypothetical protein E3J62_10510 [candidate division TA06 bacterium]|uniref:Gliding-motility protein MglA n=1 Tax=candidate division TA06 bacterium TaxID=2250710 RepID=A0A523UPB2_UNCT6|nr:MAG: hypothetical protein E3J62_10510 [candidate division TA06 bacterium]
MPVVSVTNAEIVHKIVYVGPEGSGKKTTVQAIHRMTKADMRGPLRRLSTKFAPGVAMDFFTLRIGRVRAFNTRIQVCTAPGCKDADKVRRVILRGADCVIFVADCLIERLSSNLASLYSFRADEQGTIDGSEAPLPVVYQFNKIDLSEVVEPARLAEILIIGDAPYFATSALDGAGVYEPLRAAIKLSVSRAEAPRPLEVGAFSPGERRRRKKARNSLTALRQEVS